MKQIPMYLILAVVLAVLFSSPCFANSVTYSISVTIPAIAGVNTQLESSLLSADVVNFQNNMSLSLIKEETIRDNQLVILETYVTE